MGESFTCFIPIGRAINPISGTNWEGVGVIPDVACSEDVALYKAHYLALDSLRKSSVCELDKKDYEWHLTALKSKVDPYSADPKSLKNYVGKYGSRSLFLEDGALFYQREGRPKFKLTALSEHVFYSEEIGLLIEAEMNGNKIVAIRVSTSEGQTERNAKE